MNLYKASNQWAVRPNDERQETVQDLYNVTRAYADISVQQPIVVKDLRVEAVDGEVKVVGRSNIPARLTNWSFGQLAASIGAPAGYLRGLSATLAAQNLNHGLARSSDDKVARGLFHQNGDTVLRCITSDKYTRIFNYEIAERLLELPQGWRVPPARPAREGQPGTRLATEADIIRSGYHGLEIKVGDPIAPAGLYASDHDMFGFFINEENRIAERGNPDGLCKGFFVWNSEVGASVFGVMTFYYRGVCGNHIVWDASNVTEVRIRHIGNADTKAFAQLNAELINYANDSVLDVEAKIQSARTATLGTTKEEVLDTVFGKKIGVPRKTIEAAYDLTEQFVDTDGSPRSVWGMVQGLTRVAQATAFADERVKIDRAAAKVLDIVF